MKKHLQKAVFSILGKKNLLRKKAKKSEFISWLSFANAGMLHPGNLYCFEYVVENLPSNNPIIEIGSFCGLSTNVMGYYLRKNNRSNKIITADKWIFEGADDLEESEISRNDYREFVKETFIRNISFFCKKNPPYTIEEFSDDFFRLWESGTNAMDVQGRQIQLGGPISFVYIDGNHTYEYAKRDFQNADKYLERGGFILFDDSADGSGWGVCKVIEEIKRSDKYEVVINNPNYLVRKIK